MRLVVAGDDHQAGGVAVEPVDDPGALGLAAAEQVAERVHEGVAAVAGRRVDDEAGGLVDDRQALVDVHEPRLGAHRGDARAGAGASAASAITTTPDGDRDVGDVERGPQRRVEEVGDRAVADPVGEVAERAAGDQADAQPQPRPRRVEGEPAEDQRQGAER